MNHKIIINELKLGVAEMEEKNESPFMKYMRKDRLPHIFCAGCGNGIVLNTFFKGMEMAEVDFDSIATGFWNRMFLQNTRICEM